MRYWRVPLDAESIEAPRGEVHILEERCKGCAFCVEYCPCGVLEMSSEFNRKGYHPPQLVAGVECVSCDLCEMICPEFAIFSLQREAVAPPAGSREGAAVDRGEVAP